MIICNSCGTSKNQSEYPKNGRYPDGSTRYRPDCKICYGIKRKVEKKRHATFRYNHKSTLTEKDWREALIHFRGGCAYCGNNKVRKLTKDHVVPVALNGPTTKWNIVPACSRCNGSKANRHVMDWWRKQTWWKPERWGRLDEWCRLHGATAGTDTEAYKVHSI